MTYPHSQIISSAHTYHFIKYARVAQPHIQSMISTQTAARDDHKTVRIFTAHKGHNLPDDILLILYLALYFMCGVAPIIIKTLAVNTISAKHLDVPVFNFGAEGFYHPPVLII